MQKVFNHFASGEKNGKPAMDLGGLMGMAKKTGILDGKLGEGDVQSIFNKVNSSLKPKTVFAFMPLVIIF